MRADADREDPRRNDQHHPKGNRTLSISTRDNPHVMTVHAWFITLVRNRIIPNELMKPAAVWIETSWKTV